VRGGEVGIWHEGAFFFVSVEEAGRTKQAVRAVLYDLKLFRIACRRTRARLEREQQHALHFQSVMEELEVEKKNNKRVGRTGREKKKEDDGVMKE